MLKIVYCLIPGLTPQAVEAAVAAVARFRDILADSPFSLPSEIEPCPSEFIERVETCFRRSKNAPSANDEIRWDVVKEFGTHAMMAVFCSHGHQIAKSCRQQASQAEWGGSFDCPVAYVYPPAPNKFVAWHEMFHALGAIDCYEADLRPKDCQRLGCVMQYAPTEETVDDPPYLCPENVEAVKRRIQDFRE